MLRCDVTSRCSNQGPMKVRANWSPAPCTTLSSNHVAYRDGCGRVHRQRDSSAGQARGNHARGMRLHLYVSVVGAVSTPRGPLSRLPPPGAGGVVGGMGGRGGGWGGVASCCRPAHQVRLVSRSCLGRVAVQLAFLDLMMQLWRRGQVVGRHTVG